MPAQQQLGGHLEELLKGRHCRGLDAVKGHVYSVLDSRQLCTASLLFLAAVKRGDESAVHRCCDLATYCALFITENNLLIGLSWCRGDRSAFGKECCCKPDWLIRLSLKPAFLCGTVELLVFTGIAAFG